MQSIALIADKNKKRVMVSSALGFVRLVSVASCLIFAPVAFAEVPNEFSPGTTAQSAQVNENFQFVNYGNLVVKSNGVEIGTFMGFVQYWAIVLSSQGYWFLVTERDGSVWQPGGGVTYQSNDCTGSAYLNYDIVPWAFMRGSVYLIQTMSGPSLFYISHNATYIALGPPLSVGWGTTCNAGGSGYYGYPLTPNDPTVTGVSSSSFVPPFTIERR
ncbi:MAG: hypothetical protein ACLPX5_01490 [Dissulfurispiraceae bacterium]